jgi:hypothetical protein
VRVHSFILRYFKASQKTNCFCFALNSPSSFCLAYRLIRYGKLDATGTRWIVIVVPFACPSLSFYLCHDRRAGVSLSCLVVFCLALPCTLSYFAGSALPCVLFARLTVWPCIVYPFPRFHKSDVRKKNAWSSLPMYIYNCFR